jgi:hypothetical protein
LIGAIVSKPLLVCKHATAPRWHRRQHCRGRTQAATPPPPAARPAPTRKAGVGPAFNSDVLLAKGRIVTPSTVRRSDRPRRLPSFAAIARVARVLGTGLIRDDGQRTTFPLGGRAATLTDADLAPGPDEARNCAVGTVELVLPTGAEVLLVRPTPAALPAPRLCDAYNRGLVGPIARHDRSPPPKTKAKASGRSPSTRSCIGITGAVDRREHRRPRCRHRRIQACAVRARHDCFGSPDCSSRACAMPRL